MTRWQALHDAGRRNDAIEALRSSREALPDDWAIICALAWMLAVTPGQDASSAGEALGLAVRASRINPNHPRSFDTLAAAHAANGSYDEAVQAARRALVLAGSPQYAPLRGSIEARLRLYQADQPYVE